MVGQKLFFGVDSCPLANVEFADNDENKNKVATVTFPLMHVGKNKKFLFWKPDVLKKIAPMFRGVPFKYDIKGEKGSSHVPDNVFSPYYDVGWTYGNLSGAWYDDKEGTLWVKGEVTHPEVIDKLERKTSEGKRELNYASMGVFVDPEESYCSICSQPWGTCDHIRGEEYDGNHCCMVPLDIKKALHVALTNDPADEEAELTNVIFQYQEDGMMDNQGNISVTPEVVQNMAERIKKLENGNRGDSTMEEPEKKLPIANTQMNGNGYGEEKKLEEAQDNKVEDEEKKLEQAQMGYNEEQQKEDENIINKEQETAQAMPEPSMSDVYDLLKIIAQKLGGTESAEGTAQSDDPINAPVPPEEPGVGEGSLPKAPTTPNHGNAVNESAMKKPDEFESASRNYKEKYRRKMIIEVADQSIRVGRYSDRKKAVREFARKSVGELEMLNTVYYGIPSKTNAHFADNIPEFGFPNQKIGLEVADMNASERAEKFGHFGKYEVCFKPNHAHKYLN